MARLFGTDGVRGVAGVELTATLAMSIGRAAAYLLTKKSGDKKPKILIGKDTRISSYMLESALAAGICSEGADVVLLGVVPTPCVAYLVKAYGADAGIMISASHNSYEFNGIKIFNSEGFKLSDSIEDEIEALIPNLESIPEASYTKVGTVTTCKDGVADYINHIKNTLDFDLSGIKIALDCAKGSSSVTAKELFGGLGATCYVINDSFTGSDINDGCGSTHIEDLRKYTVDMGCDIGFAFDGDADRCLACDEEGNLIDGDKLIAIMAAYLKEKGALEKDTAVVTVMSNMGFFKFAENNDIKVSTTAVGDRYVLERMISDGYVLGGEQSGHIIFKNYATTGDGQLTAVQVAGILKATKQSAKSLASIMETYPQVLINVTVDNAKKGVIEDKEVTDYIKACEDKLAGDGRILVRASGTEPLVRVMLEGKNKDEITAIAESIVKKIEEKI